MLPLEFTEASIVSVNWSPVFTHVTNYSSLPCLLLQENPDQDVHDSQRIVLPNGQWEFRAGKDIIDMILLVGNIRKGDEDNLSTSDIYN